MFVQPGALWRWDDRACIKSGTWFITSHRAFLCPDSWEGVLGVVVLVGSCGCPVFGCCPGCSVCSFHDRHAHIGACLMALLSRWEPTSTDTPYLVFYKIFIAWFTKCSNCWLHIITNYHSFIRLRVDCNLVEVKFVTTLRLQYVSWQLGSPPASIFILNLYYGHTQTITCAFRGPVLLRTYVITVQESIYSSSICVQMSEWRIHIILMQFRALFKIENFSGLVLFSPCSHPKSGLQWSFTSHGLTPIV